MIHVLVSMDMFEYLSADVHSYHELGVSSREVSSLNVSEFLHQDLYGGQLKTDVTLLRNLPPRSTEMKEKEGEAKA